MTHLFVDPSAVDFVPRFLEAAAAEAAPAGSERVFLRLGADSDLVPVARRAGFFPICTETLYQGRTSDTAQARGLFDAAGHLRRRRTEDDHDLFRLYNAATPVKVRQLVGMTFDQWSASRERVPGRRDERVLEVDGSTRGWLVTSLALGFSTIDALLHPDYAALTRDVVDAGLVRLRRSRNVVAIVPDHQPSLAGALEERGLEPVGELVTLVKSTAQSVKERVPAGSLPAAE